MRDWGFHAYAAQPAGAVSLRSLLVLCPAPGLRRYALTDDYAIERNFRRDAPGGRDGGLALARPRRVRGWEDVGDAVQADVIFSRRDADYL